MLGPKSITEPHKELRFTRSGQAQMFYILAALLLALTVALILICLMGHPSFHWWMTLPSLILFLASTYAALHCTRHAYLILTPLGIEIFPLIRPTKNFHLIYWSEIDHAEIEDERSLLRLHRDPNETSGLVLSLKPISQERRILLKKAILTRVSKES